MGNFFKQQPTQPFDEKLILSIKSKKVQEVQEIIDYIAESYPFTTNFTLDEYFDVFSTLLDERTEEIFLLLENDHSLDGKVDLYESLAALIVFCGEEFPIKLKFVFQMFDFDKSGEIEKKELVMTFQACIRALCKMVYIVPPSLDILEKFADALFAVVDIDHSGCVSFKEFFNYMRFSFELQDFLLKYALTQTYENADRRQNEFLTSYYKLFTVVAGDETEVDAGVLKQAFATEYPYLDKEILDFLMQTLLIKSIKYYQQNGKEIQEGIIVKPSFKQVIRAWAAFDSTDINHDNETSIGELKFLIYAMEGDIPDQTRVANEMAVLDQDNSGQVSRLEWINYLCTDETNSSKTAFRQNLKEMFTSYDKDGSGCLSREEIKQLLFEKITEQVQKQKLLDEDIVVEATVQTIIDDVLIDLKQEDSQVSWIDFKLFMESAYIKNESIKMLLSTI